MRSNLKQNSPQMFFHPGIFGLQELKMAHSEEEGVDRPSHDLQLAVDAQGCVGSKRKSPFHSAAPAWPWARVLTPTPWQ
jgi:hypothetical protein